MNSVKPKPPMVPPASILRRYAATLPPGEMLAMEVLFALRASAQGVENMLSQWLGSDALSPGRWQVLVVLWSSDEPMPQRDIVTTLKVSRATVSGLVETLLGEGHVTVAPGSDRRQVLVKLTPSGKRMAGRLVRENAQRLRKMFGHTTDAELLTLAGLLRRLSE